MGPHKDLSNKKEIDQIANPAFHALIVSEERYRRLFETAQDGILIIDAGTGHITDVNPFLMDMLGYSRKEFIGKAYGASVLSRISRQANRYFRI